MSTFTKLQRRLSLLGGSVLVLSSLGMAGVKAETTETAETFESAAPNTPLLAQYDLRQRQPTNPTPTDSQNTLPPLRTRLPIRASISPVLDQPVAITLRNNSSSQITYEAITATDPIVLAPGEEARLSGLDAPTTIAFWQTDGGLTQAEVTDVSRRENTFTVEFTQAENYNRDSGSVVLLESGNIYVY